MQIPREYLDEWQQEVLGADGDILLCTGRRVGKTYILARKAIDEMAENQGLPVVIVSFTEDQAMIITVMALNYARDTYPKLVGRGKYRPTKKTIYINKGKMMIRAVGNTGDAARGFEGGILIPDEAARLPGLFWLAAKPILLTTDGRIWMASTLFGTENYFYERFKEAWYDKKPDARFKVWVVTTPEVMENRPISPYWTEKQREGALRQLEEERKELTAAQFAQEYLAIADINLKRYFTEELIRSRMLLELDAPIVTNRPLCDAFLGVDVARHGEDDTVLVDVDRINRERLRQRGLEILPKIGLDKQAERIKGLNSLRKFKKIFIDTTGMGWGVYDPLVGHCKVVAIENIKKSLTRDKTETKRTFKEDLYSNLLYLMQTGKIDLLKDDRIFQSLKSVQYEYKEGGKMKIWGRNTHIAEALVRAAWCMKDKSLNIWAR